MKEQKFEWVDNAKLRKLNKQGWFVRQVVDECRVPFRTSSKYLDYRVPLASPKYRVLLEKEVTPEEELK